MSTERSKEVAAQPLDEMGDIVYIRRQDGVYFESVEGDYCQWGMRGRDMSVRWSTSPENIQVLARYLDGRQLSPVRVRESYARISGENRTRRFLGHGALQKTLANPQDIRLLMVGAENFALSWAHPDEFIDSEEFDGYGEAEIVYAKPAAKVLPEVLRISGTGYIKKSSAEICALMRRLADESEFPF